MTTLADRIATTDEGRGLAGTGLVVIWNGIREDMREDFMEWHPRQHMVERLGIPGFLRGRRCIALSGAPQFLTVYELQAPEVLLSDVYKERLGHPTEWSAATLPAFTENTRGACRILHTQGYAMGGVMLTLRFTAMAGRDTKLIEAVCGEVMPRFAGRPRITGAHFARNDMALTGGNAGNQRGRVIHVPDLVVLIEGSEAEAVEAAGQELLSDAELRRLGAETPIDRALYRLEYSVQNLA